MKTITQPTILKVIVSDASGVIHRETVWGLPDVVADTFCWRFLGCGVSVRPTRRMSSLK